MKKEKVMVAMSGGVDSAVCAFLLRQDGYDPEGITLRLWSETEPVSDCKRIAPDQNILDAQAVAQHLGIPHGSAGLGDTFRKTVVEPFMEAYAKGMTPNPCVECNRCVKFGALLSMARSLGFPYLATGHYARIEKDEKGELLLKRGADSAKDQSYFLWPIKKEDLPFLLFPLGKYTKEQVRRIAREQDIPVAHRSDSQDICFVPNGDYASFIDRHSDLVFPSGDFVSPEGAILGRHSGLIHYTIGQRKGLGISLGHPAFVGKISPSDNTVTLMSDQELYTDRLTASRVNFLRSIDPSVGSLRVTAKIRYRHTPAPATVIRLEDDRVSVTFDEPQRAISPGQSVVFYDEDIVLGGGIIDPLP